MSLAEQIRTIIQTHINDAQESERYANNLYIKATYDLEREQIRTIIYGTNIRRLALEALQTDVIQFYSTYQEKKETT